MHSSKKYLPLYNNKLALCMHSSDMTNVKDVDSNKVYIKLKFILVLYKLVVQGNNYRHVAKYQSLEVKYWGIQSVYTSQIK